MSGNTPSVTYTYVASFMPGLAGVLERSDGTIIPCNLGNMDYQQFLQYVAAGNTAPSGWSGSKNP